ncbi:MAG: septal ring lytic transglycosylase RlpA family protein [Phenylobacterium sp.]|uniref:septal ring lytic transglycosylase RlpA family protein n=1 Tax=Phenylobacterium sp. TaxID=1871053 RepID=UPI001A386220|nr:septal ring lytic transglycosylase RlpA family protein [Phenylobacterium sp.]MBL8770228.1 septal ring lytic transglycosylase RlpA family protein [Phenylobacterium sp.]
MSASNPSRTARLAILLVAGASLAACATLEPRYPSRQANLPPGAGGGERKIGKPYQVGGVWYVPREQPDYDQVGVASWYGDAFHLKATANGEVFDMNAVSAAHTTLPLPSMVEVTNLDNGRRLVVRVNDRGPFVDNRIIDLSREAARQLGMDRAGLAKVRVRYVGPAPLLGPADGYRVADGGALPTRMPSAAATPARYAARAGTDPALEFAGAAPRAPAPYAAAPVSQAPITTQGLAPVTGSEILSTPIPPPPGAAPLRAAMATASNLRVQAGAFSSQANAELAASRLSAAGAAAVEPIQTTDGMTLYRVILPAPADEAGAYALRDRVAEFGFADARVVRTF